MLKLYSLWSSYPESAAAAAHYTLH